MGVSVEHNIKVAREFLEAHGYVVLREKSYRAAQQRQAIAEAIKHVEIQQRQSTDRWAQQELVPQLLHLSKRCSFLYGAARAAGCTDEELQGRD
jgi:hypothetical protein